jgi:hypothetical protein
MKVGCNWYIDVSCLPEFYDYVSGVGQKRESNDALFREKFIFRRRARPLQRINGIGLFSVPLEMIVGSQKGDAA